MIKSEVMFGKEEAVFFLENMRNIANFCFKYNEKKNSRKSLYFITKIHPQTKFDTIYCVNMSNISIQRPFQ